jgi:serine/threonine protein phosphatase PrpC
MSEHNNFDAVPTGNDSASPWDPSEGSIPIDEAWEPKFLETERLETNEIGIDSETDAAANVTPPDAVEPLPQLEPTSFVGESVVGAFLTDRGLNPDRPVNEDACGLQAFTVDGRQVVLAFVADGMGGMESGEVASFAAGESFLSTGPTTSDLKNDDALADWLIARVDLANTAVLSEMRGANGGCTFTGVVVVESTIALGHVGDSRAYFYSDTRFDQISSDHSLVSALVRSGQLTAEEAMVSPDRNVILRSLGQHTEFTDGYVDDLSVASVFGPQRIVALQPGEGVLLVSDGVWGELPDDEIHQLLLENRGEPENIVCALIQASLDAGAPDNCSALVVEHRPGPPVINRLHAKQSALTKLKAPATLPGANPMGGSDAILPSRRPLNSEAIAKSSVVGALVVAVLMAIGLGAIILHVGSGEPSKKNKTNKTRSGDQTRLAPNDGSSSNSATTTVVVRMTPQFVPGAAITAPATSSDEVQLPLLRHEFGPARAPRSRR